MLSRSPIAHAPELADWVRQHGVEADDPGVVPMRGRQWTKALLQALAEGTQSGREGRPHTDH